MPRKALIAANWKMYKTPAEAKAFVDAFLPLVAGHTRDEIALFPSPVLLPTVIDAAKGSNVAVGCQNIHFAEEGAYTGETSIGQLLAVGGRMLSRRATMAARHSRAAAAPSAWPCMLLVELTGRSLTWEPKTARMAADSEISLASVPVP